MSHAWNVIVKTITDFQVLFYLRKSIFQINVIYILHKDKRNLNSDCYFHPII